MKSYYSSGPLVLASKSPRRKYILEQAGIPVTVLSADTDERYPETMPTDDIAEYIAANKAKAVLAMPGYRQLPDAALLAADTIVVLEGRVIGKPSDRAEAIHIIESLSGKTHEVITGVVLHYQGRSCSINDKTRVTFNELSRRQIEFYVDQYLPFDKAGAYAIQEWIGITGIKSIEGDFYNVMGLPISRVLKKLEEFGVITRP